MDRWTVQDRQGREIYLTAERWDHIVSKYKELQGRREDILTTIRQGRRKQSKSDPQTYCYYRKITNLPYPYTMLVVYVAFRYRYITETNQQQANNYVTTAWGEVSA